MLCWITLKKIYTSLAPSFWDCPPQGIRSMRRNNCPGSRDQLTSQSFNWDERPLLRRSKMEMVSTVSLWISTKPFHKSSWNFILAYKLSLWVPRTSTFLFFFFSFLLLLLRAKYQRLENTGEIVCFSFCSFLRFLFANVLWAPHSLDITWQLVIERSISLWQCLARNATSLLRFKACCWLARSPEHLCPLLMMQIQGREAGNQHCQKQLRIWSHGSSYWSPSLGTSLAVQWLRLVLQWQGWGFDP